MNSAKGIIFLLMLSCITIEYNNDFLESRFFTTEPVASKNQIGFSNLIFFQILSCNSDTKSTPNG